MYPLSMGITRMGGITSELVGGLVVERGNMEHIPRATQLSILLECHRKLYYNHHKRLACKRHKYKLGSCVFCQTSSVNQSPENRQPSLYCTNEPKHVSTHT